MHTDELIATGRRLVQRFGTRDPFQIASGLGIELMFRDDFGPLKGMYRQIMRNRFIFINAQLPEPLQKIVCAHELGHDQLHRHLIAESSAMYEFMLYDMTAKPEYEANVVAAEILLDDEEMLEYIRYGYSDGQIAAAMQTDRNLVALKAAKLRREGYALRETEHRSDFLK